MQNKFTKMEDANVDYELQTQMCVNNTFNCEIRISNKIVYIHDLHGLKAVRMKWNILINGILYAK